MSGIYGFTYRFSADGAPADALGGLRSWNRIYGREAHADKLLGDSGIGCFIEHFSDRFPYGGPILSHHGMNAVVDALLYNRDELLPLVDLSAESDISDEALLLRLIDLHGFKVLEKVNGDFAGAIFDSADETWTLFRDHMGVRPLYYYIDDHLFAFSTDLIALASLPEADLKVDELMLYTALIGGNRITNHATDYANIRRAIPAAVTRIRRTDAGFSAENEIYWSVKQRKIRFRSHGEYCAELRRLVTDSVHRRCDAIPGILGAELSGGLDSSVIDILLTRYGREGRFYSWSYSPEELPIVDPLDERNIVLDICRREGIECRFHKRSDKVSIWDRGARAVPPFLASQMLSHGSAWLRSQGARVVFTGHGGDEGISHRGRRFELFFNREYFTYYKYYWQDLKGRPLRLLRALRAGTSDALAEYRNIRRNLKRIPEHCFFISPAFRERIAPAYKPRLMSFGYAPDLYVKQGGSLHRMENVAFQGALNGMRYLLPYLDHRVMDFALSIPRREYVGQKLNRIVFRDAFRDILPDALQGEVRKENVSYQQLPPNPNAKQHHEALSNLIVDHLDRELWSEYMDLDRLKEVLISSNGEFGGMGSIDELQAYITRCLRIQNMPKNARRWKEYDDQDKTI